MLVNVTIMFYVICKKIYIALRSYYLKKKQKKLSQTRVRQVHKSSSKIPLDKDQNSSASELEIELKKRRLDISKLVIRDEVTVEDLVIPMNIPLKKPRVEITRAMEKEQIDLLLADLKPSKLTETNPVAAEKSVIDLNKMVEELIRDTKAMNLTTLDPPKPAPKLIDSPLNIEECQLIILGSKQDESSSGPSVSSHSLSSSHLVSSSSCSELPEAELSVSSEQSSSQPSPPRAQSNYRHILQR